MIKHIIYNLLIIIFFSNEVTGQAVKIARINFHFVLRTNGTGNFRETDDGDGRNTYNGYLYARDVTKWMNDRNTWNQQMNIPVGNTTPVISKNFFFVLDAVYFWRNDNIFNFRSFDVNNNHITFGRDRDSVLNVFLTFDAANGTTARGYASNTDPNSKIKYTENHAYWQGYVSNMNSGNPFDYFLHGTGANTIHELGHLLGLNHTIREPDATPCPVVTSGCPNPTGPTCGDNCADTPSAIEIMTQNNCSQHPACGWWTDIVGPKTHCSNNVMDYSGQNALRPCQINIIHTNLQGGMRSYLSCAAVSRNLTVCDIGYPKLSYFGKVVSIGCISTMANITNNENINLYYSESVELNNFEIAANAEFEVIKEGMCTF